MSALKPCPFCGCEMTYASDPHDGMRMIHHGSGECFGYAVALYCRPSGDPNLFTDLWNNRAP